MGAAHDSGPENGPPQSAVIGAIIRRMPKTKPPRRHRIEYEALSEIKRWPRNPKLHDLDALGEAFRDRGFVTPPVKDEKTGQLVEGHGRTDKLDQMKAAGEPAPDGIEVKDGEWYVPIVRGVTFDDVDQARRHLLGANRIGEVSGWDNALVADMLGKLGKNSEALLGTGFKPSDLTHFLTLAKGWESDIDAVTKHGAHTNGITVTIRVVCPEKSRERVVGAISRAVKGIRGVEIQ